MSNFNRTVPSLAALTGLPIFQKMLDAGAALPMAVGIADAAISAAVERVGTEEAKAAVTECVRSSITRLCWSKRYLEAVAAVGSMRHTFDGSPVGLVDDKHRTFAVEQLARPVSERRPTGTNLPEEAQGQRRTAHGRRAMTQRCILEIHYLGTHKPMVLVFASKAEAIAHAAAEVPKYNDVSEVIFRPVEELHPGLAGGGLPGSQAVLRT